MLSIMNNWKAMPHYKTCYFRFILSEGGVVITLIEMSVVKLGAAVPQKKTLIEWEDNQRRFMVGVGFWPLLLGAC